MLRFFALAMLMAVAAPARAGDLLTVPFLDTAGSNYSLAFLTAVRGYPSLGVSGMMQDVESCYDNIRKNERVARLQYCFFLHATVRMLEKVVPTRRAKLPSPDVLGDVRERAIFMLAQAGFKPDDGSVILQAWSVTGQEALTKDQMREFKRLIGGK